ncbi:class I SAM-dependent methyltransferase [Psychrosphaera sp.]|nr:class I SAM-dependent methyltransferase [Psychrosphaera sp.]
MNRDFNKEAKDNDGRKYAYNFDFDIMHKYMLQTFKPFFQKGKVLELGCFEGAFTQRLENIFDDITCIEASSEAVQKAQSHLKKAKIINNAFEQATLTEKFENIVMTHVLEHVDDPVEVLKRVNNEWLEDNGRFFLVCPNANAPSRQIAVKMGLISHNAAVTDAESLHGHHATYSFDTLERVAKEAGLKVVTKQGVFFKALANFQWDQLLQTDIISDEYLDGCYELGQVYPDLCASICLICERG